MGFFTAHCSQLIAHSSLLPAEGEGLEPPNGLRRRLFSRQVPHPAGCLPLNFTSSGGWNRTNDLLVQSQALLPTATTPDHSHTDHYDTRSRKRLGEKESNLRLLVQSQTAYRWPIPDRVRVPCGSRTHLARLEAWSLCRSAKGTLQYQSSGGRNRTSNLRLNRPPPYRLATPDRVSQDGWI